MAPYVLSHVLVIGVTIWVFLTSFLPFSSGYDRLAWGIYLLLIIAQTLLGVFYLNLDTLEVPYTIVRSLMQSLGVFMLVVGALSLVIKSSTGPVLFWAVFGFGIGIFIGFSGPRLTPFLEVIQAFCIIIVMLLACLGLLRRQRSGVWIVLGMMALALSVRHRIFDVSFLNPIDLRQLLIVISVACLSRAVKTRDDILF